MSRLTELTEQLKLKKNKEIRIKEKYISKNKIKTLTDKERIDRLEELLNIVG